MKIEIIKIEQIGNEGFVELSMRFGDEQKKFKAYVYEQKEVHGGQFDEELFLLLSDLGIQNLCNSGYYHFEVGEIIEQFIKKQPLPSFPIDISKSEIGIKKPSKIKIIKGRIWRIFHGYHPFLDNKNYTTIKQ